jgi:hypothetical protein
MKRKNNSILTRAVIQEQGDLVCQSPKRGYGNGISCRPYALPAFTHTHSQKCKILLSQLFNCTSVELALQLCVCGGRARDGILGDEANQKLGHA